MPAIGSMQMKLGVASGFARRGRRGRCRAASGRRRRRCGGLCVRIRRRNLAAAARVQRVRRVDDERPEVRALRQLDLLRAAFHRRGHPALRVPHEVREHIVDVVVLEGALEVREERVGRLRHARRHLLVRQQPPRACRHRDRPLLARRVGQLQPWMVAEGHRHRLGREIDHLRAHLEHAGLQAVGHLDRVGERPLFHPRRLLVDVEPAREPRRRVVVLQFDDLPLVRQAHEAVDRDRARDVARAACRRRSACRLRRTPARRAGCPTGRAAGCPRGRAWPGSRRSRRTGTAGCCGRSPASRTPCCRPT